MTVKTCHVPELPDMRNGGKNTVVNKFLPFNTFLLMPGQCYCMYSPTLFSLTHLL